MRPKMNCTWIVGSIFRGQEIGSMRGEYEVAAHGWEDFTQRLLIFILLEHPKRLLLIGSVLGWYQETAVSRILMCV